MSKNNIIRNVFIALTIVSFGSFIFLQSIDYDVYADINTRHQLETNIKESVTLIEIDFVKSVINTILNVVKV